MVFDSMLLACGSHRALPHAKHLFLGPYLKSPRSFQNEVDFILSTVNVPFLLLTWLETVDVAEKSLRLKKIILLHLFLTVLLIIRQTDYLHRITPLVG